MFQAILVSLWRESWYKLNYFKKHVFIRIITAFLWSRFVSNHRTIHTTVFLMLETAKGTNNIELKSVSIAEAVIWTWKQKDFNGVRFFYYTTCCYWTEKQRRSEKDVFTRQRNMSPPCVTISTPVISVMSRHPLSRSPHSFTPECMEWFIEDQAFSSVVWFGSSPTSSQLPLSCRQ